MFKPLKYCKHRDVSWCWKSPNDIEFYSGEPFRHHLCYLLKLCISYSNLRILCTAERGLTLTARLRDCKSRGPSAGWVNPDTQRRGFH